MLSTIQAFNLAKLSYYYYSLGKEQQTNFDIGVKHSTRFILLMCFFRCKI